MASANDQYRQAQKGDESAFSLWMGANHKEMGRFAYQMGISIEELPNFQQTVLLHLRKQLEQLTPGQAEIQLYRIMIQLMAKQSSRLESGKRQVLGFQEDQELHMELQKLELAQRVPLVLTHFHNSSIADISTIIEVPEHQLKQALDKGMQTVQQSLQLDGRQLLQRLEMLGKSYQRFMPSLPTEQGIQNTDEIHPASEALETTMPPQQIRKKPLIVLGAAGLFLAAVIGVSFSVNDQQAETAGTTEYKKAEKVTDEMVADWRNQYETIKETSPKRLGMSQEQYGQLEYVKQSDAEMEKVFSDETLDLLEDDPMRMQNAIDRLFRQIETPRGMTDSLSGPNPMPGEEIEGFLRNYAAKTDELRVFADSVLLKYQQELESTVVMDQLSPEKLLAASGSYTEELRFVVEALPEYNLFAIAHPNGKKYRTVRDVNILSQQQPIMNDPYAWQYLNLLSNEPYFDDSGFLMPIDFVSQQLLSIEQALLEEEGETLLFDGMEVAYQQVFWQLVKGSEGSAVFDGQGKVKAEYRSAWNDLASSNPMAFLMLPILEEMEASDWTASAHYDELKFRDLMDALAMGKSGELADKLPNGNLIIEDEFIDMQDFDYNRIQPMYDAFKISYDLQLLAGVPPLDVLFMYHYANKLGDTETLWHLLADSPLKPTLDRFEKEWKKIPELTENADWVELSADSFKQRVKNKIYLYPQVYTEEFDERLNPLLVTERDQIWQIDYQHYESYDLLGEDQQYKQIVDALYTSLSADSQKQLPAETKPGEVAGVFLKAAENKDISSMRKLSAETGWTDEEFGYFLELHSFRPFSELAQLTFKTNFNTGSSLVLTGTTEIKYDSELQNGLFQEMFFMEKTVDGWRMANLINN